MDNIAIKYHDDLLKACIAAKNALRSYQYGNSEPDLACEIADRLETLQEDIAKAK